MSWHRVPVEMSRSLDVPPPDHPGSSVCARPTERREGSVHADWLRGRVQPEEARGRATPGPGPARAHTGAPVEEGREDSSQERGKVASARRLRLRCMPN